MSGGLRLGGSTTFLVNLAGELVRRGFPVQVLSLEGENPLAADFERQHVPLLGLDDRRMIFEDRLEAALKALARFQPTVVVSTLGPSFEILRYLPHGLFRVGMGQSDDPIVYEGLAMYAAFMDKVAVVARTMREKMQALPAFSKMPVVYLPYGVPMATPGEISTRDPSAPLRVLYLGRLEQEQKRVRLFPEILRHLAASGIPFHWTIAGEGSERGYLEARLRSPSATQTVSFAGAVAYAAVPALLARHDVFLLASDYEGLPLSLLEAMGCGLVPVVSDLPSGIPEVVDKTTGCLVPIDHVAGYAQAIVELHQNRDLFAARSTAARARVEKNFSVGAMTDGWLAALPPLPALPGPWPDSWRFQAPLRAPLPLQFSPPVRWLRRMVKRLR